jgi:hypothetical protein
VRPVRNVFYKLSRTEQRREGVAVTSNVLCTGTCTPAAVLSGLQLSEPVDTEYCAAIAGTEGSCCQNLQKCAAVAF